MNIQDSHKNWTELGKDDPLWVVLTDPDKKGGKWTADEFFATGLGDVKKSLDFIKPHAPNLQFGTALDFGCGVGRLSQALATHFDQVDGVDISESMIQSANKYNKHGERVRYHLNVSKGLELFPSGRFDFVFTLICLQHIPPQIQLSYIREFMRVLKKGGVAYFQCIYGVGIRQWIPSFVADFYRKLKNGFKPFISMYPVSETSVNEAITAFGGTIVHVEKSGYQGFEKRFNDAYYIIEKTGA